ncbi:tRNA lysidine(34) synthetase TilS [bacterium]|nr:tRNA lysidine(34) synthetase TilS [bacterium]
MDLQEKFEQNLEHRFLREGDQVLLAVSGGLDSSVMLELFRSFQDQWRLNLQVVHVHHGIRGSEADHDANFVQSLAKEIGVPFILKRGNARKIAREGLTSLETAARTLRYAAFAEALVETHYAKLATAHTQDDQAETVLDRFLRGTGIRGLGGIHQSRGPFIRPLLHCTRQEVEQYALQKRVKFREDSSNNDLRFKRNRIRRELVPYLTTRYNPSLIKAVNRLSGASQEVERFLDDYAWNAFKSLVFLDKKNEIILDLHRYINYFDIVKKYILFHACEALEVDRNCLTFEKLQRTISLIQSGKIGSRVIINKECELFIDHDGIVIRKGKRRHRARVLDLDKQHTTLFEDYKIRWSIMAKPETVRFDKNPNVEFVDLDVVGANPQLRNPSPGDRFVPLNFAGRKKVADYFSDQKVPHHLRDTTPILESSQGIVWVCGYCIDDRFKITERTKRLLKLEILNRTYAN